MASTPLTEEIDRLKAENAQLKRALEVLAQQFDTALIQEKPFADCPLEPAPPKVCPAECSACLRNWAMDKAKK